MADEEMEGTGIGGIQTRLMTKVLPILERHLTESKTTKDEDGQPVIRSFVVMSIIKLLRRMPLTTFQHGIGKLVSTIVSRVPSTPEVEVKSSCKNFSASNSTW